MMKQPKEKWFDPNMDAGERRMLALKKYGDNMSCAQNMQLMANDKNLDKETRIKAAKDAEHFIVRDTQGRKYFPIMRHTPRITRKTPRIR